MQTLSSNMGVAIDLTLVHLPTGAVLEMGTPYDTFSEAAHTANAEGEIRRNRQTLVEAMAAEGFEKAVKRILEEAAARWTI